MLYLHLLSSVSSANEISALIPERRNTRSSQCPAFRERFPPSRASTKQNEKHKNINLRGQSPKNIIIQSTNFVDFKLLFHQTLKRFHVDVAFERFLDETQKFLKFFIHAGGISENIEALRKIFKIIEIQICGSSL